MARYTVLETSFINNQLVEAGDTVEFDGIPGKQLVPIDAEAKKAAASAAVEAKAKGKAKAKPVPNPAGDDGKGDGDEQKPEGGNELA